MIFKQKCHYKSKLIIISWIDKILISFISEIFFLDIDWSCAVSKDGKQEIKDSSKIDVSF